MHITELQRKILLAMRDKPISGGDLKRSCGYTGSDRGFAAALMRMWDKGLLHATSIWPLLYVPTELGKSLVADTETT